jgi:hypothetical protein
MFAKMGVMVAVLMLALPACHEVASIAAPEADKISVECPNPERTLEILHPQTGACFTCGCCARVGWKVTGANGDVWAKVEAWYGNKHVVLGDDLLNLTTFRWQVPDEEIPKVRLRVSANDAHGRIGASETIVSFVASTRGPDPKHQFSNP